MQNFRLANCRRAMKVSPVLKPLRVSLEIQRFTLRWGASKESDEALRCVGTIELDDFSVLAVELLQLESSPPHLPGVSLDFSDR